MTLPVADVNGPNLLTAVLFLGGSVIALRGFWSHTIGESSGRGKYSSYSTVYTTKRSEDPFGFMWEVMAMYALGGILILASIAMFFLL